MRLVQHFRTSVLLLAVLAACAAPASSETELPIRAETLVRSEPAVDARIKVACVGDSITFGTGIPDRDHNSYPAQLGQMLGAEWNVQNFGVSGTTLLNRGDRPYTKTPHYQAALAFQPDVVLIKLGTNDTKQQNWKHKSGYIGDYLQLINSFRTLESKPVIWICNPVPVFPEQWGIKDSIVREEILPRIQYIAQKAGVPLIDLYTLMKHHPEFFPDKVHPNAAGATVMATTIASHLSKNGQNAPSLPDSIAQAPSGTLVIWDDLPAYDFEVAYPVGNGRLGAMPFGQFPTERILINEETIWENSGKAYMEENGFQYFEKIRELEAAGDFKGADDYFTENISKKGSGRKHVQSYQLAGWLKLDYQNTAAIQHTHRSLDLKTSIATNTYTLTDGSKIIQKTLASAVDDLIAIHITADKPIHLAIGMEGASVVGSELVLNSKADGELGTQFQNRVRVMNTSNAVTAEGNTLSVKNATDITLYLTVATNFNRQDAASPLPDGWQAKSSQIMDAVQDKGFGGVESAAIADHQSFFNRVNFNLGTTSPEVMKLTTKDRLQRLKAGAHDDLDLMETYFQFGRYLLIASSRPDGLPANLQGIWNPYKKAPWASDFHLNINLQMNYWPAETCNLGELHQPVFNLLRLFQVPGKDMARRMGMKGWAMGHCTDIWGSARNMDVVPMWSATFLGGQWLTFHILEHYRFNLDPKVLVDNWDILTASTEFCESWLIPGPDTTLIARPATSPENAFRYIDKNGEKQKASISAGSSVEQWMILQVFNDYVEAAGVLGKMDDPFVKRIQELIPKIYRPKVADDGRLMEWMYPFEEASKGHRHISHVIGAYPGNVIDLDDDPVMRSAVIKSIDGRIASGGAGTGWSRAWTIGMYARFSDGEKAYENFHAILTKSTLDNLWDNHPPFQIDGNFGATAAVAEMLLHSHNHEIKLLPALPSKWPDGHIKGLKARGDTTVDIRWANGELTEAVLRAGTHSGEDVRIVYQGRSIEHKLKAGESVRLDARTFDSDRQINSGTGN